MRRFVEITTRVVYLWNTWYNQTVREVQVTIHGTIILRVLDGPNTLLAILVLFLRTEVIEQVGLQTVAIVNGEIGIFHDLLQVGIVDAGNLIGIGIILTVSLVELDLSQEGSTCSLCGSAFLNL